jgi:hypothetical protein
MDVLYVCTKLPPPGRISDCPGDLNVITHQVIQSLAASLKKIRRQEGSAHSCICAHHAIAKKKKKLNTHLRSCEVTF